VVSHSLGEIRGPGCRAESGSFRRGNSNFLVSPGCRLRHIVIDMPAQTKTALGEQGAAVAQRKRTGGDTPRTRAELYEIARQRGLAGRSKMGRDELARKVGLR